MQEELEQKAVGSVRAWELIVAAIFLVFGSVVMWGSWRLGARWGSDGPQAGYFPFYVGLFIVASAAFIILAALKMDAREANEPFVRWGQLRLVLTIMVPSVVYVALIDNPWLSLGIYVPSALFIGAFMRFLGKYRWITIAAVSVGTMVAFFVMFEIWFQVPLPKGPLEAALGFN
ncbi:MAG: tripartite tricarboxylate transporter TctB family protein [Usitatibacter sp.]